MPLFDFIKPKKKGYYETEYFKNLVKISELEEQQKISRQREKIAALERKVQPKKAGLGGQVFGAMMGAGMAAQQYYGGYGYQQQAPKRKKRKK